MDRHPRGVARLIAVIGGGWAGCAAAVELARQGLRVELHEAAGTLGGRARAVLRDGLPLDNGEHLLLGAYAQTQALAAIVHDRNAGSPWTTAPLAIRPFAAQQSNAVTLRARNLPAPLGLLIGLLTATGFTWGDRIATIRWFAQRRAAGFRCAEDQTVASLVAVLPARVRDNLWTPVCLAALNTPPARASAQVFLNVLREVFAGDSHAAQMVVPRHGLGAAIPDRAGHWLASLGHRVHLSSRMRIVATDDCVHLANANGESRADAAIVAVGPHQLASAFDASLATREPRIAAALAAVQRFAWEPITTVYLGYAGSVTLEPGLLRLDDAPGQWVFDRADILARAAPLATRPDLRALLSVVLSAHGAHDALDHAALVTAIDAQLRRLKQRMPALRWAQVIAEKRATYACVPGLERPACGHLAGRIHLAGDYTYAAFPATLEAAVRSGVAAARTLVRDLPA